MTDKAFVYKVGLCALSVCAPKDMPIEMVEEQVNQFEPTGIQSRWMLSYDDTFATGHPNPCPCEQDEGRQHWLLSC